MTSPDWGTRSAKATGPGNMLKRRLASMPADGEGKNG